MLFSFQIDFDNRKRGDTGNDCLLSTDGTDYPLAMSYMKEFYSHKFKKCGLRYEIGLNILTGDICWWLGPFEPGIWNDIKIFKECLQKELEPGERVQADQGYVGGYPDSVFCPPFEAPDRREMTAIVRLRHETCNRRFKRWNILKAAYRHDLMDHNAVFGAIACLTQLSFHNGEPLFPVEYED